jgi:serine/threonine protein kinase
LRKKLGSGAFGTVYRAYDPRLDREVALKLLRAEALASPKALERFQREARAAARMQHPHIVAVHDFGTHKEQHFLVSAFISGCTLASANPPDGMEVQRAVRLTLQLVEALAYAHQQGVMHRDVKPANIMLDDHDSLYLMDFGLAGWTEQSSSRLTKAGALMGTPAYMAPEQATGDISRIGPAADLYSAGVVLYELLTGRVPFEGSVAAVVYNAIHTPPPPPSSARAGLDADLEALCLKALAKNPDERFSSGEEMAKALQGWLHTRESRSQPSDTSRTSKRRPVAPTMSGTPPTATPQVGSAPLRSRRTHSGAGRATRPARKTTDQEKEEDFVEAKAGTRKSERTREKQGALPLPIVIGGVAGAIIGVVTIFFLVLGKSSQTKKPVSELVSNVSNSGTSSAPSTERPKSIATEIPPELKKEGPVPSVPVAVKSEAIDPDPDGPPGQVRTFEGHTGGIRRLVVSPDGQLLTGSFDRTIRLWDVANGKELRSCQGHTGKGVHAVAFLSDGRRAFSGGYDKGVYLWDLKSGAMLRSFVGHEQWVSHIAVSSDDRMAASCGPESTIFLWDVMSGKVLHRLAADKEGLSTAIFSPDNRFLLTGGATPGRIRLWAVATGTEIRQFKGHTAHVTDLAFTRDGKSFISVSHDSSARLWSVEDGNEIRRFGSGKIPCYGGALSPDGTRLITADNDGSVRLWAVDTGKELHCFSGHKGMVMTAAFSPDGKYAYTAGEDRVVRLWRLPRPVEPPQVVEKTPGPPVPAEKKMPVPTQDDLDAAEKEIKEVHKAEYARRKLSDLQTLAQALLKEAPGSKDRPAVCYGLFREARDLAARSGDVELALRAADEMAHHFAVSVLQARLGVAEVAGRRDLPAPVRAKLLPVSLMLAETALEADEYELAERCLQVVGRDEAAATLRKAHEAIQEPLRTLASKPDDPEANTAVGKFHALVRGNWDRALDYLARGEDRQLKALAEADLACPSGAKADQLADDYVAAAAAHTGAARIHLQFRASYWYGQALNKVTGLDHTRVEKKALLLEKSLPPSWPVVLHARVGAGGRWMDIADRVRLLILAGGGVLKPFGLNGFDPAPGERLTAVVVYRYRGAIHLYSTGDTNKSTLPGPADSLDTAPASPAPGQQLTILYARYGYQGTYADVAAKIQPLVKGKAFTVKADDRVLGDPIFGKVKGLVIVYRVNGRIYLSITSTGNEVSSQGEVPPKG